MKFLKPSMKVTFTILTAALAGTAFATGGESSGGGDAVICKKSPGTTHVWLADLFDPNQKSSDWLDASPANSEDMAHALFMILSESDPALARKVAQSLSELDFRLSGQLPELDDDFIDESKLQAAGCRKQQLAIQDRVEISQKVGDQLARA